MKISVLMCCCAVIAADPYKDVYIKLSAAFAQPPVIYTKRLSELVIMDDRSGFKGFGL